MLSSWQNTLVSYECEQTLAILLDAVTFLNTARQSAAAPTPVQPPAPSHTAQPSSSSLLPGTGTSASSSNMDVRSDGAPAAQQGEEVAWEEMPERIQVKIADLGNGEFAVDDLFT